MAAFAPGSLLAQFRQVPDPRDPKGCRYPHTALLGAACAAILCGARSFEAIAQWARLQDPRLLQRLGFYRRPPTAGAYRYLFVSLDAGAFEAALARWAAAALGAEAAALRPTALDGKTNEHKAAPGLLEGLVLDGRVVTGDAMFCHRDVAETILGRGGHYFFTVKDNQPALLADIAAAFEPAFSPA